jgi:nucleoside-diphosphate-sugar epimerase
MKKNYLAEMILDDVKDTASRIDFSMLSNKSILITGASGLIGTYLLATLTQARRSNNLTFQITLVVHSKLSSYMRELIDSNDKCIQVDLSDYTKVSKLDCYDFIFHAAGYGQPGKFMLNPLKTIALNTTLTAQLLDHLNPNGRFLFISSSEVYSGLTNSPFNENQIGTTSPQHQRACYIEGKRSGEAICSSFMSNGGVAVSARLSLAYGPGVKIGDARVLNSFIQKALINHQIDMLDSGEARRTYCYVGDAVTMLINIWLFGKNCVYNVGGTSRTTIKDLAKKIGKITNSKVLIPKNEQTLSGAPEDVSLDISLYSQEFGKPLYRNLNDGLINTINWYKELTK